MTVVYPEGRITSDNAAKFEQELRQAMKDASGQLIVDAQNLCSISSAGLRALLVLTKESGRKLTVRNVSPEVYEIFEITGFSLLLDVRRRMRSLSIEGCKKVGEGALGSVYQVAEDTIVKVFRTTDSMPVIQTELDRSRQAFVKGLPTAIPFDIVQVGNQFGAVYEMLNAETLNDYLIRHPEQTDEMIRKYVQLLRQIHSSEALPGELPSAVSQFLARTSSHLRMTSSRSSARGCLLKCPGFR